MTGPDNAPLAAQIAAALADELPDLHSSLIDQVAHIAARVARANPIVMGMRADIPDHVLEQELRRVRELPDDPPPARQ